MRCDMFGSDRSVSEKVANSKEISLQDISHPISVCVEVANGNVNFTAFDTLGSILQLPRLA